MRLLDGVDRAGRSHYVDFFFSFNIRLLRISLIIQFQNKVKK